MSGRVGLIASNSFAQGVGTGSALLFTMLGTRLLPVADYGELRFMMIVLPLAMALSLPGFDSVILRATGLRARVPLVRILVTRMLAGCLGSLLTACALIFLADQIGETLRFLLVATAVLLPMFETATGYRNYLLGRGLRNSGNRLLLQARLGGLALFLAIAATIQPLGIAALWIYPAWMATTILFTMLSALRVLLRRNRTGFRWRQFGGRLPLSEAVAVTLAGVVYTFTFSLDKLGVRTTLGPEQLALYSLLIMVPQELAKLVDSNISLFYRDLFFSRDRPQGKTVARYLGFALLGLAAYVITFHWLSALIFGPAYHYSIGLVALSCLLFAGQSTEYFIIHQTLAVSGARAMFGYSLCNLFATSLVIWSGLMLGGIVGLILLLVAKQITLPVAFGIIVRKPVNVL
jgi:O-antigen/teichoic acid export membrane protein